MKKDAERRWMRRLVRWGWLACFLGNYEWYRRLYGGLWAHVQVEEPCYSCMWLNCPDGADETYREGNWRGTPEFRNYDTATVARRGNQQSRDCPPKSVTAGETAQFMYPHGECPQCGGKLHGDGYSTALHCENAEGDAYRYAEPDAPPVHCIPNTPAHPPQVG